MAKTELRSVLRTIIFDVIDGSDALHRSKPEIMSDDDGEKSVVFGKTKEGLGFNVEIRVHEIDQKATGINLKATGKYEMMWNGNKYLLFVSNGKIHDARCFTAFVNINASLIKRLQHLFNSSNLLHSQMRVS